MEIFWRTLDIEKYHWTKIKEITANVSNLRKILQFHVKDHLTLSGTERKKMMFFIYKALLFFPSKYAQGYFS